MATIGPILGIAAEGSVRVVIEPPAGVVPELEIREEAAPGRRTDEPDGVWSGAPVPQERILRESLQGQVQRFTAQGLDPLLHYRYRMRDPARGTVLGAGRFRAVPASLTEPASLLLVSCNKFQAFKPPLYDHMWSEIAHLIDDDPSLRLIIHCGDQVYCDEAWDRCADEFRLASVKPWKVEGWLAAHRTDWKARYEKCYRDAWARDAVRRVLRSVPNLMMWDDHDIHDGYGSRATDFWTCAPFLAGVATEVFDQYQASLNPAPNLGSDNRGFSLQLLGCRLIVLDTRSRRNAKRRCLLGDDQWAALNAVLESHGDHDGPLLLVSSTPVFNIAMTQGGWRTFLKALAALGEAGDDLRDAWSSTTNQAEMRRLLTALEAVGARSRAPRVVLTGDIHTHHLARWRKGSAGPVVHQVTASPLTNKPIGKFPVSVTYGTPPFDRDFPVWGAFRGWVDWFCNKRGFAQIVLEEAGAAGVRVCVRYWIEDRRGEALVAVPWVEMT